MLADLFWPRIFSDRTEMPRWWDLRQCLCVQLWRTYRQKYTYTFWRQRASWYVPFSSKRDQHSPDQNSPDQTLEMQDPRCWELPHLMSLYTGSCSRASHHEQHTVLASRLAPMTWTWDPAWERRRDWPQWQRDRCRDRNIREVNWSWLEMIGGVVELGIGESISYYQEASISEIGIQR